MVRLTARLPPRVQTNVILTWRHCRGFHHKLSQFILPKSNRTSINPLPLPAELNEPHLGTIACNLDVPSLVNSSYIETCPASQKWFKHRGKNSKLDTDLFKEEGGSSLVPLEYLGLDPDSETPIFKRFKAPLATFASFVEAPSPKFNIYLAQCDFDCFPKSLQGDLKLLPRFLKKYSSEKCIYGRNIWIGTSPTYTPLHRDPNHNYFQQLAAEKKVRLMSPETGLKVYQKLASDDSNDWASGADPRGRIRTEEMMASSQRQDLYQAVWENQDPEIEIYEGTLSRGQAMFIPAGWWHSFKSEKQSSISASLNYWFQFDSAACSLVRDIRRRRHEACKIVSQITLSPHPSLRWQIAEIKHLAMSTDVTEEQLLGDSYHDVMAAEIDYRRALYKWGYRDSLTSDFFKNSHGLEVPVH